MTHIMNESFLSIIKVDKNPLNFFIFSSFLVEMDSCESCTNTMTFSQTINQNIFISLLILFTHRENIKTQVNLTHFPAIVYLFCKCSIVASRVKYLIIVFTSTAKFLVRK